MAAAKTPAIANKLWEISYAPNGQPMRMNDGALVVVDRGDPNNDDETFPHRVALVDFYGKAKRGEKWNAPIEADPIGFERAALIAAVPDLKAALMLCLGVLSGENGNTKKALTEALEAGRNALAKAGVKP